MEHLYVDDAMHDRVLQKIKKALISRQKDRYRKTLLLTGSIAAAVIILAMIPRIAISHLRTETKESPSTVFPETAEDLSSGYSTEYRSAERLSKAVGFEMKGFTDLPFEVDEVSYRTDPDNIAEITYIHGDDTLCYRKATDTVDIFGDYSGYEQIKEIQIGAQTVTLRGDTQKTYIAVWTDGDHSYMIEDLGGLTENVMTDLARQICRGS